MIIPQGEPGDWGPAGEGTVGCSDPLAPGVPLRILVIEDNRDAADTLRDYLELCGHEVEVAYSGPQGVERAGEFLPDVVLCDIGLPGMSGWDVARALRGAPGVASARLIAISGYGTEDHRRRSVEAGFDAHLTKPVDMDALDAMLGSGRTSP